MTELEEWVEPEDDEQVHAMRIVERLMSDFFKKNKVFPKRLFVSDDEELQSFILWSGQIAGLRVERTSKRSYVE